MTAPFPLKPGDWIGTIGTGGLYEPVYGAIRAYSRRKYPVTTDLPNPEWRMTHVRLLVDQGRVFEMTLPVGRFQTLHEAHLAEKFEAGLVRVCRFVNAPIDPDRLHHRAAWWDGRPYDASDLLNFGLSGVLGVYNSILNIFGIDKRNRFAVCSTCAADIIYHATGGAGLLWPVGPHSIDPNAPFNRFGKTFHESTHSWWHPVDITHLLTKENFA